MISRIKKQEIRIIKPILESRRNHRKQQRGHAGNGSIMIFSCNSQRKRSNGEFKGENISWSTTHHSFTKKTHPGAKTKYQSTSSGEPTQKTVKKFKVFGKPIIEIYSSELKYSQYYCYVLPVVDTEWDASFLYDPTPSPESPPVPLGLKEVEFLAPISFEEAVSNIAFSAESYDSPMGFTYGNFFHSIEENAVLQIQKVFRGWRLRKSELNGFCSLSRNLAAVKIYTAVVSWWDSRRLKSEKALHFINYTALFIQKIWKGYQTRKFIKQLLRKRLQAKTAIGKLLVGYKTRKILKSPIISKYIKDIDSVLIEPDSTFTQKLYFSLKEQMVNEFWQLYNSANWVALTEAPNRQLPIPSGPPKKFNYLRQNSNRKSNSKERTRSVMLSRPPSRQATKTPTKENDSQRQTTPRCYLKRKSTTIKAEKLSWKAKSKIDCWVTQKKAIDQLRLVEQEYVASNSSFLPVYPYLQQPARVSLNSVIPQLKLESPFITMHTHQDFTRNLELLENTYFQLIKGPLY